MPKTESRRVERDDRPSLHVHVTSPDEKRRAAVVLVHGLFLSGKVFYRWAETLAARGIEAYSVDLSGHGESAGRDRVGKRSVHDYADDVEAVLDAAGAEAIIGHDMGGLVGQIVAARRPLRGLALVSSFSPGIAPGGITQLWRELRPRYVTAILRGKPFEPANADLAALAFNKLGEDDKADVVSWLGPESGTAAREIGVLGVTVDETKVRCPVLVAAMTHDQLTPPAKQRSIAAKYHADYVEFAQHAHLPMLEPGWERPIAVVAKWLEEAARLGDDRRGSMARMRAASSAESTPRPKP